MERRQQEVDFGLEGGETFEPREVAIAEVDTSKPYVMTVLGPIQPDELGVCLPHEHVLCNPHSVSNVDPDYRLDDRLAMQAELEAWSQVGGASIVDASTPDYGRDPTGLHWLAQRSPVHLIMVSGRHKALHSERFSASMSSEELRDEFVREFRVGVGPAAIRPGVIKFGTSLNAICPIEERAAIAAAHAAQLTGLPITTHTEAGTMAIEHLDLIEREGLPLRRVILGHLDRNMDHGYLRELLVRGAWVSFDPIGTSQYGPDRLKAAMLARLIRDGYGEQLLISMDLARKSHFPVFGGGPGWAYILQRFTLALLNAGLHATDVRQLMVTNPMFALSVEPIPSPLTGKVARGTSPSPPDSLVRD